jgi:two-component system, OmpR family, phosphate regulon response regulator PhoB
VARILVVEDEPAIQELLALTLSQAGHEPVLASDAAEGYQHAQHILPDVVLLDWMLPGMSGIEFARKLRSQPRTKNVPIIMLTAKAEEQDKLAGLETGADDYMVKPFSTKELNARIKAVLRRRAPQMVEDRVQAGELVLDPVNYRITANGKDVPMGPTEFKLMHFFMTHPERVYSRIQLLDHVWGDHVFIEERTVDVHIRRLRSALEIAGQDHVVQTVRGVGYRFSVA